MTRLMFRRAASLVALLALILVAVRVVPLFNNSDSPSTSADIQLAANLRQGRIMQALYQIEAQALFSGWTPALQRRAGDLWRDAGDLSTAVAYWRSAAVADANDAALAKQIAMSYVTLHRWTEAADALNHLLALAPDDSWAHYQLGLIRAPFDPQNAATHLEAIVNDSTYGDSAHALIPVLLDHPADPLNTMRVGVAMADLQLWPYAELAFGHVGSSFPEALAYVGLSRDMQGKDGSAWIAQALTLDPENPQVLYLDGLHLRTIGQTQQSLDRLTQAATLEPQNPAFLAELGTAYRLVNDMPSAEYWLKAAVALAGSDSRFEELLVQFYAEEGYNLTSGGLDALEQAARLFPDDPDVLASYGWSLYTIGDTEAALSQLDAALAVAPNNLRSLYYKAQILLEIGNLEAAAPLFEQVAASDSEFAEEARRILQGMRE